MTTKSTAAQFCFEPVGIVHSCFRDKFGVPRQPQLAPAAQGRIELLEPYNRSEALRGLEGFSHLWVVFVFHRARGEAWKPTVRPPRLGGNTRIGVFASRSPQRPNPLGLSLVRLDRIEQDRHSLSLHISNLDLIDGTPVLDIKPYLPYADYVPGAAAGYADTAPGPVLQVEFSPEAMRVCAQWRAEYPQLELLIRQVLQQDPRPAYHGRQPDPQRLFGMRLHRFEIKWRVVGSTALVDRVLEMT
jgi:tRNA-Thr(GGU) m(6)t(6)A37 methyltransferase TsaA